MDKKIKLEDLNIKDVERMTNLTNEYIDKFIKVIDPRDYNNSRETFVEICITGPSMISASVLDKISGTFHLDRKELLEKFIKKLELALRWVDHKEKKGQHQYDPTRMD